MTDRDIAAAIRMRAVYEKHRDKLAYLSGVSQYSAANRQTMVKALRSFCQAMDAAERGGNEKTET